MCCPVPGGDIYLWVNIFNVYKAFLETYIFFDVIFGEASVNVPHGTFNCVVDGVTQVKFVIIILCNLCLCASRIYIILAVVLNRGVIV